MGYVAFLASHQHAAYVYGRHPNGGIVREFIVDFVHVTVEQGGQGGTVPHFNIDQLAQDEIAGDVAYETALFQVVYIGQFYDCRTGGGLGQGHFYRLYGIIAFSDDVEAAYFDFQGRH